MTGDFVHRWGRFLVAVGAAWGVYFASERWLVFLPQADPRYMHAGVSASVAGGVFRQAMGVATLLACVLWVSYLRRVWLRRITEQHLLFLVSTCGCSFIIVFCLYYQGREASFYQLLPLIEHPEAHAISGHRLLFIWPAQLVHHLFPSLSSKGLLIASQVPAALFTTTMIGFWSAAFVGRRLAFLGQFVMLVFLLPTISYYDFYDIAIVGFYASVFLALLRKRFWISVPLIAIATLNHENALLLIPAVGFVAALSWSYRKVMVLMGAALMGYAAVRVILWHFMPMSSAGDIRPFSNAVWISEFAPVVLVTGAILSLRYICALLGWKYAPPALKRLAIIWPPLLLVTLVFGQLDEPRQFNADIPLAVGLLLVYVRHVSSLSESVPVGLDRLR